MQAYRLVPHVILILLSAKRGICEYHFFKVFCYESTWEMNPKFTECEADVLTTTPSHRLMSAVEAISVVAFVLNTQILNI